MYPNPESVPTLLEYLKTEYADAKSHLNQGQPLESQAHERLGDLAMVVLQELKRAFPEYHETR